MKINTKLCFKKLLAGGLAALLLLSACGPSTSVPVSTVNMDAEIVLGGYRNLAPGERDGNYCSSILYVWEPLISQDERALPIPGLAESWVMSEDGMEWIFKMREGVRFHDGEPFNADAVIANFDRMMLGVKSSVFYNVDINSHYPELATYEKVDEYRVKLTFKGPAPTQLFNMVNFGSAIFSPKGFDEEGNFNGIVQGTGPFKIIENVLGQYVLLERNEDYYGEKAKAKTIRIRTIPDADTRFSALKSGEIMGVLDLNAIPAPLAVELLNDDNFAVSTAESTLLRFLTLNGTRFPFNDVRMRQAFSLALDRSAIVDGIYNGFASPTTNILNYSTPFYKEFPVDENMGRARVLAREVLGDQRVPVIYMVNGVEPLQRMEAELISVWLAEIGLDVSIQTLELAVIREQMRVADYDIARFQQGLSNSEAATIFRRFMLSSGDTNQNYSLAYQSDEVDRLLAEAAATLDMNRRIEIYNRIQEISTQEFPVMPLFNDMNIIAYSKQLTGYDVKLYGLELPNVAWAQ